MQTWEIAVEPAGTLQVFGRVVGLPIGSLRPASGQGLCHGRRLTDTQFSGNPWARVTTHSEGQPAQADLRFARPSW